MVAVTRVNGSGLSAAGNVFSNGHVFAFKILVKIANGTAVDLRGEDDAIDETVEAICKEINPLMYCIKNDASGEISIVMDGEADQSADIQARIRALGTVVGPNNIDVTGTDVIPATSFVVTG